MHRFPIVLSLLSTVAALAGCDRAPDPRGTAPVASPASEPRQDELPIALVSDYLAERDALGEPAPAPLGQGADATRP